MKKKGNGNILIWLVLALVVVGFTLWYLLKSGYLLPQQTVMGPSINNTQDLTSASNDLDGVNLNQMDPDLNQISSDSSSF